MGGGPIKRRNSIELVMIREQHGYISMGMPMDVDPDNTVYVQETTNHDNSPRYRGPVRICPSNGLGRMLGNILQLPDRVYSVRVSVTPISSSTMKNS